MDIFLSWVKQIFILSILSNMITHLMPSPKYAKYASYICGLMIMMVCIVPITNLLNGKLSFDQVYDSVMNYETMNTLKKELAYQEGDSGAAVIAEYEKELAKTVEKKVLDSGYYPAKTAVTIDSDAESPDYGTIQKVELVVSQQKETTDIYIENITIGDSKTATTDYTELRNEIAQMLHTTISCVAISSR